MLSGANSMLPATSNMAFSPFKYQPALDGLRGISILLVLSVHLRLIRPEIAPFLPPGGFLGVDIFFVVSGFLITSLLLTELQSTGDIDLRSFYYRRALRLFPALIAVILFTCVLAYLIGSFLGLGLTPLRFASTAGYFTNWVRAYEGAQSWFLFHFWSLSVEEQFYILWPGILLLLTRAKASQKVIMMLVVVAIVISAALKVLLFLSGSTSNRIYYGSDTRADSVLVGCAASMALTWGYIPASSKGRAMLASTVPGAVIILVVFVVLSNDGFAPLYLGGLTLIAILVALIILHLVLSPSGNTARILKHRWLLWIGKRSYGLYLWHWPLYELSRSWLPDRLSAPAAIALTFLVATVSYQLIENPFLLMKKRRRHFATQPVLPEPLSFT
jgi:peptidoglycan/LPS O-acetylase OafA/YrhL